MSDSYDEKVVERDPVVESGGEERCGWCIVGHEVELMRTNLDLVRSRDDDSSCCSGDSVLVCLPQPNHSNDHFRVDFLSTK